MRGRPKSSAGQSCRREICELELVPEDPPRPLRASAGTRSALPRANRAPRSQGRRRGGSRARCRQSPRSRVTAVYSRSRSSRRRSTRSTVLTGTWTTAAPSATTRYQLGVLPPEAPTKDDRSHDPRQEGRDEQECRHRVDVRALLTGSIRKLEVGPKDSGLETEREDDACGSRDRGQQRDLPEVGRGHGVQQDGQHQQRRSALHDREAPVGRPSAQESRRQASRLGRDDLFALVKHRRGSWGSGQPPIALSS